MGSGDTILRNQRHERFAQFYVSGMTISEAYLAAGFKSKHAHAAGSALLKQPHVALRVKGLQDNAARKAELSRKDILDRILDDWNTSRKLGQMASALKAGELLGKEMFRMFVDRKEVGGPGDFDNKSEDELRKIIKDGIKELGWGDDPPSDAIN